MTQSETGNLGEDLACEYLQNRGYEILERNWTPGRWGEADIIAIDNDALVLVEVRASSAPSMVSPQESVIPHKLYLLKNLVKLYNKMHPNLPQALRIDFVGVNLRNAKPPKIELFKNISG
mgnify:CR=1 FL=1